LPSAALARAPVVAAASSLRFALTEIAAKFEAEGGGPLSFSFSASGKIARQIEQGAPFDLFLSANEAYARRLVEAGMTEGEGGVFALGQLSLVASRSSALDLDGGLRGLAAAVAAGKLRRFAIANPAHAPYGMAAREVLSRTGLWQSIAPRLVIGENVAQAAQFTLSPDVDGGLVARSLAVAPALAPRLRQAPVPASMHSPLAHRGVLLKGAAPAARAFLEFLLSAEVQPVLQRHGYLGPGRG